MNDCNAEARVVMFLCDDVMVVVFVWASQLSTLTIDVCVTWVLKEILLQQKKAKKLHYRIFLGSSGNSENVDV